MPTLTYTQLLTQNRSYRLLWLGQVVSFFGDWFKTIALYAIARELSPDAGAVANIMVATLLPIFLVTPIAGSIADRFVNAIYAVLVVMVAFSGIFLPARTASVPAVTSREELPAAMALSGGTWSVMLAFGAAAGGLVTQAVGLAGGAVVTLPRWGDGLFSHTHGPLYTGVLYATRGTGAALLAPALLWLGALRRWPPTPAEISP